MCLSVYSVHKHPIHCPPILLFSLTSLLFPPNAPVLLSHHTCVCVSLYYKYDKILQYLSSFMTLCPPFSFQTPPLFHSVYCTFTSSIHSINHLIIHPSIYVYIYICIYMYITNKYRFLFLFKKRVFPLPSKKIKWNYVCNISINNSQ